MDFPKFCIDDHGSYRERLLSDLRSLKDKALAALSLEPGKSVIDVGCGRGLDSLRIGTIVGRMGLVLGIALKEQSLQAARALALAEGMEPWVHYVKADACNLPLPDNQFDSCYCERVLQHLPAPCAAVIEMSRVLKKGGRLALLDTDWETFAIDCEDMQRLVNSEMVFRKGSRSGRRLFALSKTAGLADIQVTTFTEYFTDLGFADYFCGIARLIRNAVARGVISELEARKLADNLISIDSKGQFFAMVTGVLVSATKHHEHSENAASRSLGSILTH